MMRWKKIGFGIWLAAVLAMVGCGARDAAAEAMGEAIPVEPIDGHQKELKELRALSEETKEKTGTVFRIYYDNTRSMMGYVAVGDGNAGCREKRIGTDGSICADRPTAGQRNQ